MILTSDGLIRLSRAKCLHPRIWKRRTHQRHDNSSHTSYHTTQTAVVNGCNSGIENAFAHILIKEGYQVYATYQVYPTDYIISGELRSPPCHEAKLDVRSEDSIQAFASVLAGKPVDLLLTLL
ncbi:hypothetical protein BDV97DRAFT_412653 [Delphinella strobiligena]|nr:hypothetical protein BDV97DRAFT_412653 [Delphinella strobiligena]